MAPKGPNQKLFTVILVDHILLEYVYCLQELNSSNIVRVIVVIWHFSSV